MSESTYTTFLIRTGIVFALVVSSWLAWFAALWFVDYAKMHGTSFQFVESVALIVTMVGVIPMLVAGAGSGIMAAAWITRRRYSDDEYHINTP